MFLKDFKNNNFKTELAFINTKSKKLFGKDVEINLDNKSFNRNNDPRLKGRSIINDENFTEVQKGIFTTCKRNDKCPPWQLSAPTSAASVLARVCPVAIKGNRPRVVRRHPNPRASP